MRNKNNSLEPINWIAKGAEKGLIRLSPDKKRIEYLYHGISRDFTKPEASVEVLAYISLVMQYDYPPDRIRLFAPVTMGSELREADIGFDATGKETKVNELEEIGKQLASFIKKERGDE